jgi:hypothetical protein
MNPRILFSHYVSYRFPVLHLGRLNLPTLLAGALGCVVLGLIPGGLSAAEVSAAAPPAPVSVNGIHVDLNATARPLREILAELTAAGIPVSASDDLLTGAPPITLRMTAAPVWDCIDRIGLLTGATVTRVGPAWMLRPTTYIYVDGVLPSPDAALGSAAALGAMARFDVTRGRPFAKRTAPTFSLSHGAEGGWRLDSDGLSHGEILGRLAAQLPVILRLDPWLVDTAAYRLGRFHALAGSPREVITAVGWSMGAVLDTTAARSWRLVPGKPVVDGRALRLVPAREPMVDDLLRLWPGNPAAARPIDRAAIAGCQRRLAGNAAGSARTTAMSFAAHGSGVAVRYDFDAKALSLGEALIVLERYLGTSIDLDETLVPAVAAAPAELHLNVVGLDRLMAAVAERCGGAATATATGWRIATPAEGP